MTNQNETASSSKPAHPFVLVPREALEYLLSKGIFEDWQPIDENGDYRMSKAFQIVKSATEVATCSHGQPLLGRCAECRVANSTTADVGATVPEWSTPGAVQAQGWRAACPPALLRLWLKAPVREDHFTGTPRQRRQAAIAARLAYVLGILLPYKS